MDTAKHNDLNAIRVSFPETKTSRLEEGLRGEAKAGTKTLVSCLWPSPDISIRHCLLHLVLYVVLSLAG